MEYERRKHDGSLPIVGVNMFTPEGSSTTVPEAVSRATEEERARQVARVRAFHDRHRDDAPAALDRLREAARGDGNVFAELMTAVRSCSLGQITEAFFEVGGQYRRGM